MVYKLRQIKVKKNKTYISVYIYIKYMQKNMKFNFLKNNDIFWKTCILLLHIWNLWWNALIKNSCFRKILFLTNREIFIDKVFFFICKVIFFKKFNYILLCLKKIKNKCFKKRRQEIKKGKKNTNVWQNSSQKLQPFSSSFYFSLFLQLMNILKW